MFSRSFSTLISNFRPDAIRPPRPCAAGKERIKAAAEAAMLFEPGGLTLSQRLRDPLTYNVLQQQRRLSLEALLSVSPSPEVLTHTVDLIAAICEESTWSENLACEHFDDENHPPIDLQCAETAVLFGWTFRMMGKKLNEISPRITNRMLCELRRRIFRPLQAHTDYPFMAGGGRFPMVIACDLLLSALLMESDTTRVSHILKPVLRALDECCIRHGRSLIPFEETICEISAVSDLAILLQDMTCNALALSEVYPTDDWLDEILFSWIDGLLFLDPAGNGLKPTPSGSDIFRIGSIACDEALMALGAKVWRANHRHSGTVTGRLMELSACGTLEQTAGKLPRMRYAATRGNLLMSARIPGLYCAMHTGGANANAGEVLMLADGTQILADGGRSCHARSLPTLAGQSQLIAPRKPCIAEFEAREDREIMSVDLTAAYPETLGLQSFQRTLITLRPEGTIRLVDALALREPSSVVFRFITAANVTVLSSCVRLGPVRMTWEGSFHVNTSTLENGLTELLFTAAQPVQEGIFSFSFEHP